MKLVRWNTDDLKVSPELLLEIIQPQKLRGVVTVGCHIHNQNHLTPEVREINGSGFENIGQCEVVNRSGVGRRLGTFADEGQAWWSQKTKKGDNQEKHGSVWGFGPFWSRMIAFIYLYSCFLSVLCGPVADWNLDNEFMFMYFFM